MVRHFENYTGTFAGLLDNAPHMAVFTIADFNLTKMNITIAYNDTMQHSLPVVLNIFSNTLYK